MGIPSARQKSVGSKGVSQVTDLKQIDSLLSNRGCLFDLVGCCDDGALFDEFWILVSLSFVLGLSLGCTQPSILALLQQHAPPGRKAEAFGLRMSLINGSKFHEINPLINKRR